MADLDISQVSDAPSQPQQIADPVPEEADFLLRSELSPEQGVFFGDLITLKAPFTANTFHWKKDGKALDCHTSDLFIKAFTPEDIGEYSVEDDLHQSSATIVLVRHKAPIKYCLNCGKRNHAHSKKCNTCGEILPLKEKPVKRKHESLSMKHYEDSIVEKISEMKENFGDDVDVLFVMSRTHYSRTLCTVKGTEGAAQQFLSSQINTPLGLKTMQSMIQDAWGLGLEQYYNAKGGRMGKKSGKWKKTKIGGLDGTEPVHDEGAVQALFRALAPFPAPPQFGGYSTPMSGRVPIPGLNLQSPQSQQHPQHVQQGLPSPATLGMGNTFGGFPQLGQQAIGMQQVQGMQAQPSLQQQFQQQFTQMHEGQPPLLGHQ